MNRRRPSELAKLLVKALEGSTDAQDRLIARILRLHLPNLASRKAQRRNLVDDDFADIVFSGVSDGIWKSEKAACDDLAKKGYLSGAGTPASKSARLYKRVLERRPVVKALELEGFAGGLALARFLEARLTGKNFVRNPERAISEEKTALDDLLEQIEASLEEDESKSLAETARAKKLLSDFAQQQRSRRRFK